MRFNLLRSIGHNLADALACGLNFPLGYWATDVFADAASSEGGVIEVDFLEGRTIAGRPSTSLIGALTAYKQKLVEFCGRHGADISEFQTMQARFGASAGQPRVVVLVEDTQGRRAIDEYVEIPLQRIRCVDSAGRVRRDKGYVGIGTGTSA